ncbi:MAG TPA: PAS domain S-box protein, partial [Phycisphaerae bacterium]|nr:PAS domain S-box protein [Phycisphaerae bacterium]
MARKQAPRAELIIALGASAGGVEALQVCLGRAEAGRNHAYVILQHVDPADTKLLAEALQAKIPLPVTVVERDTPVRGDHVYIVPAHTVLSLVNERLRVDGAATADDRRNPIDRHLRALAEGAKDRAVGVILSGAGTDGTLGLKAISEAGGLTVAQAPETARYDGMPRNAVMSGVVDQVLAPEQIADELARYGKHVASVSDAEHSAALKEQALAAIPAIAQCVQERTGVNFQHYKSTTLVRRILRRLQVLRIGDVDDYIRKLREEPDEARTLYRELLISVTAFFRDPEAFDVLGREVLKPLISRGADEHVRIWVPGCATGEEAYSLAILVREMLSEREAGPEVQIFATDIDERALEHARNGAYAEGIADSVGPERLRRFFVKRGKRFHVTKELRGMCLFSAHNLISDPPFSRLDLISCRNLLIYLGPHLQKKLFPLFHYALRPGGYLFLGPSEPIDSHRELFKAVSAKHRISQRKATAVRPAGRVNAMVPADNSGAARPDAPGSTELDVHQVMQRIILDEFAPKSAVVHEDGQIVCASGNMSRFLEVAGGIFQNNIIKLARSGLRVGLRAALAEAVRDRRTCVHNDLSVRSEGDVHRVTLTVQPMPKIGDDSPLFMVVFQEAGPPLRREEAPATRSKEDANAIIEQLERELDSTRQDLEKSVQDLEAANEELKSSNEELLSMNEELQSANEELETSKEEVQAGHDALSQAHSDLENLLRSTDIAVIFLDEELLIRSYTPAATRIYNLIPTDVGRPLAHLTHHAEHMPSIPSSSALSRARQAVEHEVITRDGRHYRRRALPYRARDGQSGGVVLTFVDVTELARTEAARREAEERLRDAVEAADAGTWRVDLAQGTTTHDASLNTILGLDPHETTELVERYFTRVHPDDQAAALAAWEAALAGSDLYDLENRIVRPDGSVRWIRDRGRVFRDADGKPVVATGACIDITDQKSAEIAVRESEARFRVVANAAPVMIWMSGADKHCTWFNDGWLSFKGRSLEEELGDGWVEGVHPEDHDRCVNTYNAAFEDRVPFEIEYRMRRADGAYRWVLDRGTPLQRPDGAFFGYIGSCIDVHDRVNAEAALRSSQQQLRLVTDALPALVAYITADERYQYVNRAYTELRRCRPDDIIGHTLLDVYGREEYAQIREHVAAALHGEPQRFELRVTVRGTQDVRLKDLSYVPHRLDDGSVAGFYLLGVDITERKRAENALRQRERQQATIAALGHEALSGADLTALFTSVVEAVADVVDVDYCSVLELLPGGEEVFLRAGVGWRPGLVGNATVSTGLDSQAGYTLIADEPVVVDDLRSDERFRAPPLLTEHGVVSGMSCIIHGPRERPWGVLGAHSRERRHFTRDDVHYLQAVANVLAAAIQRAHVESAARRLALIVESSSEAIIGMTLDRVITSWNRAAEEMYRYPAADVLGQSIDLIIPAEQGE